MNSIAILDFGSQYAQIIARRVRESQVYCELFPWDAPQEKILSINPKGFILSGGPKSVYEENAPARALYDAFGFIVIERFFNAEDGAWELRCALA